MSNKPTLESLVFMNNFFLDRLCGLVGVVWGILNITCSCYRVLIDTRPCLAFLCQLQLSMFERRQWCWVDTILIFRMCTWTFSEQCFSIPEKIRCLSIGLGTAFSNSLLDPVTVNNEQVPKEKIHKPLPKLLPVICLVNICTMVPW